MNEKHRWPDYPYIGLAFFGQADTPLFAGREDDVLDCAKYLTAPNTRVLILHGRTGSGKSSFLRAGLIPALERGNSRIRFLRESLEKSPALLIRSTNAPMEQLAGAIYKILTSKNALNHRDDKLKIDLQEALLGAASAEDFVKRAGDPGALYQSLQIMARALPEKIVIIIDQAEEVLTLSDPESGDSPQDLFFEFIRRLILWPIDVKLLISIRTEFFGWFSDELGASVVNPEQAVSHYYLREFNESQIEQAIERPTSREEIPGYGVPHDQYRFDYEPGLARTIAKDLLEAETSGGILLVMQMVCRSLFESTRSEGQWTITSEDYKRLGAVSGRIDAHVNEAIRAVCRSQELATSEIDAEVDRWHLVLATLARRQDDGTVTTLMSSEEELKKVAIADGVQLKLRPALAILANREWRILREVELVDRETKQTLKRYCLGHDAIGLVLAAWNDARARVLEQRESMRRRRRASSAVGALLLVAIGALVAKSYFESQAVMRSTVERINAYLTEPSEADGRTRALLSIEAVRRAEILASHSLGSRNEDIWRETKNRLESVVHGLPTMKVNMGLGLLSDATLIVEPLATPSSRVINLVTGESREVKPPKSTGERGIELFDAGYLPVDAERLSWIGMNSEIEEEFLNLYIPRGDDWDILPLEKALSADGRCKENQDESRYRSVRAYIRNHRLIVLITKVAQFDPRTRLGEIRFEIFLFNVTRNSSTGTPVLGCKDAHEIRRPMGGAAYGPYFSADFTRYATVDGIQKAETSKTGSQGELQGVQVRIRDTFSESDARTISLADAFVLQRTRLREAIEVDTQSSQPAGAFDPAGKFFVFEDSHRNHFQIVADDMAILPVTKVANGMMSRRTGGGLWDSPDRQILAVRGDGSFATIGDRTRSVVLIPANRGGVRLFYLPVVMEEEVDSIQFSRDGQKLIVRTGSSFFGWDLRTSELGAADQPNLQKLACDRLKLLSPAGKQNFDDREWRLFFGSEQRSPICEKDGDKHED